MRVYQEKMIAAIDGRSNWGGNNTIVKTNGGVSEVFYYQSKIGVINHNDRTAKFSHCGWWTVTTSERINCMKRYCERMGYAYAAD
jgi:hypothetical protein